MQVQVNREELIRQLECVQPGLSRAAIQDQSNCFVFQKGKVFTFNEEVACSTKTNLPKKFEGAIQADNLLPLLIKMPEETLQITKEEEKITIKGKRRKASIRLETEIMLAIDTVEVPEDDKWLPLKPAFAEALDLVCQCTSKSGTFCLTCVHVTPKGLEATDTFQLCRYKMKMGIKEPFLLKQVSIKNLIPLGMTEYCQTKTWIHFKNENGLVFSCRQYIDEFPDLTEDLKQNGTTVSLPKGLPEAIERAEIFSKENGKDDNLVLVEICKGNQRFPKGYLKITGKGERGEFEEFKSMSYSGKKIPFFITPKLLSDLCKNYNTCEVNNAAIQVVSGRFTYVACLTPTDYTEFVDTDTQNEEE